MHDLSTALITAGHFTGLLGCAAVILILVLVVAIVLIGVKAKDHDLAEVRVEVSKNGRIVMKWRKDSPPPDEDDSPPPAE